MSSKNTYRNLVKGENFFRHFLLLAIRLYWGGLLIVAGFGKWLNLSEVTHFFATLNIPWPGFSAWLAGLIELVGGISLVLGLWSRISTLFLIALFIVAYATAHSVALINFFIAPTVFFEQPPFLYLYASLIVCCFGSGFFSIDYWIERSVYGRSL